MVKVTTSNTQVSVKIHPTSPVKATAKGTVIVQTGEAPAYTGPYEVIPSASQQRILSTAGRIMKRDVTVHPVPYWETSNDAGGTTVYIASGKEDM